MTQRELSFDGKGINGPDEYRTRIATFANEEAAKKYSALFEAAPDMKAALLFCIDQMEQCESMFRCDKEFMAALNEARAAIAKATGAS